MNGEGKKEMLMGYKGEMISLFRFFLFFFNHHLNYSDMG